MLLNIKKTHFASASFATVHNLTSPSQTEKEDFFHEIAKEKRKKPVILSVIELYSEKVVHSSDHFLNSCIIFSSLNTWIITLLSC